jgi:hypothetical protein
MAFSAPALMLIVSEIGAWAHVDVERTCPIEEMQVLSRLCANYLPLLTMF